MDPDRISPQTPGPPKHDRGVGARLCPGAAIAPSPPSSSRGPGTWWGKRGPGHPAIEDLSTRPGQHTI